MNFRTWLQKPLHLVIFLFLTVLFGAILARQQVAAAPAVYVIISG
jgi:hypothetical protein